MECQEEPATPWKPPPHQAGGAARRPHGQRRGRQGPRPFGGTGQAQAPGEMEAVRALPTHLGPPIQSQSSPGDFQGGQGQQLHFLLPYTGRPSHQLQLRDPQHQRGDFGQSSKCLYFSFQKRFIQLPVAHSNKVRRSPTSKTSAPISPQIKQQLPISLPGQTEKHL